MPSLARTANPSVVLQSKPALSTTKQPLTEQQHAKVQGRRPTLPDPPTTKATVMHWDGEGMKMSFQGQSTVEHMAEGEKELSKIDIQGRLCPPS
ncbi:hypothetical protein AVEN_91250-1 [Araneus ventricosus]|uniref:Uncharacterized protein n=1 Tax=Araneus ventricosus TaxID=182803 RepID=A0A4Y2GGT1_ARAVE|nr:hypothetical protein AVEN_91250-1 [Araneus ventricosus]